MTWMEEWLLSGVRLSLPLIFAAFGGMLSERSGVANIALEAYLMVSGFAGAAVMSLTHSLPLSVFSGLAAAILVGAIFSYFTLWAKADQIIAGMGINILIAGIIPVACKTLFSVSGITPALKATDRITSSLFFFILAITVVIFVGVLFSKTVFGLRVSAAGENPKALRTQGVNVERTRFLAILLGASIAGWGGLYLSIGAGSGYTRNMSAGRGYIALAALILGQWRPLPTLGACVLFGLADALQILVQSIPMLPNGEPLPTQVVQALPYILTLLFLAGFGPRSAAPKAINQ